MDGNMRWAVPIIIAAVLAGIFLFAISGSASAARIYGIVTDSSRTPVPGAIVTLYQNGQEYAASNNPTTTGINGFYEFDMLPTGAYSAMVEKDGFTYSGTASLENGDVELNMMMPGYTYRMATPTIPPVYVTQSPTAVPTATPTATPKPTPKVSNTPVPLPTLPPAPGFEVLLALAAIGLIAIVKRPGRK